MSGNAFRWVLRVAASPDGAIALACALAALSVSVLASAWVGPFLHFKEFDNLYFQADCSLVYANMTERHSNHYRTGMHPMFSVVMWPLTSLLRGLGLDALTAVRVLLGLNAGASGALLFLILRKCGLRPFDAALFALSFAGSTALLVFGTVPETFAFGGTTLLLVLLVCGILPRPSERLLLLANVASMSMTLTNWMAGILSTLRAYPQDRRVALRVLLGAGVVVGAFGLFSKLVFSSSGYAGDFRRYVQWVRFPQASDVRSFFVHSVVMPEAIFRPQASGVLESVAEPAAIGAGSGWGVASAGLWLLLLAAGALAAASRVQHRPLRDVLVLTLAGQLALHLCFADGPFLFSAHFAPLLLVLAAHALLLPLPKWPMRLAVGAVLAAISWNNVTAHRSTVQRFELGVLPWLNQHGHSFATAAPAIAGRGR